MKPRISILGTGRMGSALARAFLKQGYETSVWNRTKSNVSDYVAGDALLRPDRIASELRGRLLVQLTSGSPKQAREMAAWAERHDIRYLDGAIMATPDLIGGPECTILYSGPGGLFEEYKLVLLALGETLSTWEAM